MKQIAKTPEIIARLKEAGAEVDEVAIFEAIALNNRPLRKRSPIYNGAVAQRSILLEMALALETESRPVQIMHEGSDLPIGRVFRGQVFDGQDTELRVLLWIDKTHQDKIKQVDNGTVDQVSVGILPKQMICSADGFDFFGPDASFENIFTGTTPDGHTVGENGVYCKMVGLEAFFEISLVGQGGAQNARIVNSDQSRFSPHMKALAAKTSLDRLALTATATIREKPIMDVKELLAELRSTEKESMKVAIENEQLKATNTALTSERDTLKAALDTAKQGAPAIQTELDELKTKHTATEASLTAADAALREICKKVLTAAGQVDAEVPAKIEDVVAKINETKINLTAGGRAKGAEGDLGASGSPVVTSFRTRR
ncbi:MULTISPECIES: hypothetical protein [unclassified Mesorhizobium]|uniref:hypothetical protein n=1 Tax=unclassified Mesorhizobium TaxID=325217 RepID=UPI0011286C22|nr:MULTISPECIES: hypothetical protein [unclassified Mesorhizobium]TPJ51679.1 hypothetical protein FJ426_20825 [Mesorhizobium sp. B2-6-4]TPN42357.1 hypothetical protein FJ979_02105 [Mesorhizobium sp. B1-1-6]